MKTKPILLIVVTLIIGFVLGMLTSAQVRFQRLKPVRVFFSEEKFKEGFYKVIQPDERQKAITDQIISKYAKLNTQIQNNFRKEMDSNFRLMRKELDSNLTKEQLTRLKELDEQRQEMMRRHKYDRSLNDSLKFRKDMGPRPGQQEEDMIDPMAPPPPSHNEKQNSDSLPNRK